MEVGGLVALLLILAVLPIGYTDVKGHTDFRRWPGAFSSRLNPSGKMAHPKGEELFDLVTVSVVTC